MNSLVNSNQRINHFPFTVILLLSLTSILFAQEVETKKTFFPNGTIKTEGTYVKGELNGIYKEYYPNGRLWTDF